MFVLVYMKFVLFTCIHQVAAPLNIPTTCFWHDGCIAICDSCQLLLERNEIFRVRLRVVEDHVRAAARNRVKTLWRLL